MDVALKVSALVTPGAIIKRIIHNYNLCDALPITSPTC